jgi:hypothetical protein
MADAFDEIARDLETSGPDQRIVDTTGQKRDVFDVLQGELAGNRGKLEATRAGAVKDLMVVGPLLEHGYQAGKTALGYDPGFTGRAVAANPDYAALGGLISNTAATGGIGATKYGAMALGGKALPFLGQLGENLLTRMGVGATSGGALGAADAYMRGESPVAGGAMGAVAGGAAPAVGGVMRGLISPFNTPTQTIAQRTTQPAIDTLTKEGVRLSAGDLSGNRAMKGFEDLLRHYPGVGGQAEDLGKRAHMDFTTSALRRANPNLPEGTLATPEVLNKELGALKTRLDTARNNTVLYPKHELANDLRDVQSTYARRQPVGGDPNVNEQLAQLQKRLQQGSIPGEQYQALRTDLRLLGEKALGQGRAATPESNAYFSMRKALDDQMERDVSPAFAAEWKDLNRRYGNLKTIEDAMTTTAQEGNKGFINPRALGQAIISRSGNQYARNAGPELTELARAGNAVLKPLPESGTGRQLIGASMVAGAGGVMGGALGFKGSEDSPVADTASGTGKGAMNSALAALLLGRVALSQRGQQTLMNKLLSTPRAVSLAAGPLQQFALPGRSPTLRDLGE